MDGQGLPAEWYLQEAWMNFSRLLYWMANTTILSINGQNVTFMGLLIALAIFDILVWLFFTIWKIYM